MSCRSYQSVYFHYLKHSINKFGRLRSACLLSQLHVTRPPNDLETVQHISTLPTVQLFNIFPHYPLFNCSTYFHTTHSHSTPRPLSSFSLLLDQTKRRLIYPSAVLRCKHVTYFLPAPPPPPNFRKSVTLEGSQAWPVCLSW
jgi:hypothetical protein